jgi:hypothetical protein
LNNSAGAVLFVGILLMGLAAGWIGGNMHPFGPTTPAVSETTSVSLPVESASVKVVNLDIIADWGGGGYDAFIIPSYANGTAPPRGTDSSGTGPSSNNVTVSLGVPVTFVITNLDTAVIENYTGNASVEFTIYNNTDDGQVVAHYSKGQAISGLQISHTFSVPSLGIDIPIPPDTIVTFTYTFTSPGVFEYMCETPCGPGMGLVGYMNGYVIVG